MDWEAWLSEVFKQHLFNEYRSKLENRFENADQVVKQYVQRGSEGRSVLSAEFFRDIGIDDAKHRELFKSWFNRECGTSVNDDSIGVVGVSGGGISVEALSTGGVSGAESDGTKLVSRGSVISACSSHVSGSEFTVALSEGCNSELPDWLTEVDWSVGVLSQYSDALKTVFNDPEQITRRYIVDGPNGARYFQSQRFNKDVGILPEHSAFFEAWFFHAHGALPRGFEKTRRGAFPDLSGVDWNLGILQQSCGPIFQKRLDGPEEIERRYCWGGAFDADRFFKDFGIVDEEQRQLLRIGIPASFGCVPR